MREAPNSKASANRAYDEAIINHTLEQAKDMACYALDSGIEVEPKTLAVISKESFHENNLSEEDINELFEAHGQLAAAIKPALPRGVNERWKRDKSGKLRFDSTPRIVKETLGLSIFFLLSIIVFGAGSLDNEGLLEILEGSFFFNSWNWKSLQVTFVLLSSAALGACFYNLYVMYDYIIKSTFDPKYYSSYRIRIVLGVVAGFMLAEMLPVDFGNSQPLEKPLLALIGGFSAEAVNWILQRFVETVKTLVKGGNEAILKRQKKDITERLKAKHTIENAENIGELASLKTNLAAALQDKESPAALDLTLKTSLQKIEDITERLKKL